MSQTIGRRPAAEIKRVLADWLAERIEGASGVRIGELRAPSANGFSNITAVFEAAWRSQGAEKRRRLVARIEPTGEGLFPTYDVGRQFDIMRALEFSAVPAPKALWIERDATIAALVRVHQVDWRGGGLDWLRRRGEGTSAERELAYYEHFYRWAGRSE